MLPKIGEVWSITGYQVRYILILKSTQKDKFNAMPVYPRSLTRKFDNIPELSFTTRDGEDMIVGADTIYNKKPDELYNHVATFSKSELKKVLEIFVKFNTYEIVFDPAEDKYVYSNPTEVKVEPVKESTDVFVPPISIKEYISNNIVEAADGKVNLYDLFKSYSKINTGINVSMSTFNRVASVYIETIFNVDKESISTASNDSTVRYSGICKVPAGKTKHEFINELNVIKLTQRHFNLGTPERKQTRSSSRHTSFNYDRILTMSSIKEVQDYYGVSYSSAKQAFRKAKFLSSEYLKEHSMEEQEMNYRNLLNRIESDSFDEDYLDSLLRLNSYEFMEKFHIRYEQVSDVLAKIRKRRFPYIKNNNKMNSPETEVENFLEKLRTILNQSVHEHRLWDEIINYGRDLDYTSFNRLFGRYIPNEYRPAAYHWYIYNKYPMAKQNKAYYSLTRDINLSTIGTTEGRIEHCKFYGVPFKTVTEQLNREKKKQ